MTGQIDRGAAGQRDALIVIQIEVRIGRGLKVRQAAPDRAFALRRHAGERVLELKPAEECRRPQRRLDGANAAALDREREQDVRVAEHLVIHGVSSEEFLKFWSATFI